MPGVPDCLSRRYRALDELIQQLNAMPSRESHDELNCDCSNDPGIKLMCDFWSILKENPDCNLTQAVKQRMGLNTDSSVFRPQQFDCYMADKSCKREDKNVNDRRKDTFNKIKQICCGNDHNPKDSIPKCCVTPSSPRPPRSDVLPLTKVLCSLKEAASFDKKCDERITELVKTQKELEAQVEHLEHREKEGIQLLKQADCMWSCMENTYKKKLAESLERQKGLLKQLKDVEASNSKWRKNKKDLELQMVNINKCQQEITEKISQKQNDIKCMDMEISGFNERIENNKKDAQTAKNSLSQKKQASDNRIASITAELKRLSKNLSQETKQKDKKVQEGKKYVKEAREDLQKICKVLLQKKLENEDLRAEKDALEQEIDLLKQTCDQCKDKCIKKQESMTEEIKRLNKEIKEFKAKCIKCHQCTDTDDARKLCSDCPRCLEERDCLIEDDHCQKDSIMDCACMAVKQKFLDNVFENMYTVLERQSKKGPGKAVADTVLKCLKKSRNGKLNDETRSILQDFVLTTVKKNLNLTIIGGAVKTRCEMDPETYQQLMLCLKEVKAVKPPKADKGTAKKESCSRWGGTNDCNCPKGPNACVCTKRAPPPPKDPSPCPPEYEKEDPGEIQVCPHKESTACGPDCAMHAVPSAVDTDVLSWKRDPCAGPACPFSKNMRAAQCVLGPECLQSPPMSYVSTVPYLPDIPVIEDMNTCQCGCKTSTKQCQQCQQDRRSQPRETIIEEVMGKYTEVSPIDKVSYTMICSDSFDSK